jgi:dipeptide/tripeptide permease
MHMSQGVQSWRFPRMFWTGNAAELCERAAYYGTFIALSLYLTRVVGLDDVQAGWVAALFGSWIYLIPFFTGALADRIGFRYALMIAFVFLTLGYGTLGFFNTMAPVGVGLALIVLGGSIVKPVISGTVSKSSNEANRARAFSIFYMVVNIGSFTGKTVVADIRIQMGVQKVPFFSAAASLLALIIVVLFFFPDRDGLAKKTESIREVLGGMWAALSNLRFLALILITAGFWSIQGQLYASMPKYVLRMAGEGYKPEWLANINPFVVVVFVVMVTHLVRKWKPQSSILVAMLIIPFSAVSMAASAWIHGNVNVFGLEVHPLVLMMVIGIALQGIAECFLSPKWLEFASLQAPKGQEGTFLGYAHINTFIAWLFGFAFSGYLLREFCPEPSTLDAATQAAHQAALAGQGPMPEAYAHAHYLWYAYVGVGLISLIALFIFIAVTKKIDEGKATAA